MFLAELKKAQAGVPEPAQTKIKLKVGQSSEPPTSSKRITIHVGGRGGSVDSPAPQASQAADTPLGSRDVNGTTKSPAPNQLDPARSVSASMVPPSPSPSAAVKGEEGAAPMSPAGFARPPSAMSAQFTPGAAPRPPIPAIPTQPYQNNALVNGYTMEPKRLRTAGKGLTARSCNVLVSS